MDDRTAIDEIIRFQVERGLDQQPFDEDVATINVIEELLESYGVHDNEKRYLSKHITLKILEIVAIIAADGEDNEDGIEYRTPTVVDKIDAYGD